MITIKDVIAWLKPLTGVDKMYNSFIPKDESELIGVYTRQSPPLIPTAIGTESSYSVKAISLLVHWTQNSDLSERKALEVLAKLRQATSNEVMGGKRCYIIANRQPIPMGRTETGVFEFVIWFDIYVRR